jgi:16S rRNA (cytidine1402-2'-O)-methyltransferase
MATGLTQEALWALIQRPGCAAQEGTLHLIATPIGNLGDLTLRAARLLADVDHLFCEDTRVSAKLLAALGLKRGLSSLHEHNESGRIAQVVEALSVGQSVGLISDAGMPLLSDPGGRLVAAVVAAGLQVTTAPGASAALSALVNSGLPVAPSVFLGFAERKKGRLAEQLAPFAQTPGSIVFFEAPGRIAGLLTRLFELLGDRVVVVGRELTKKHETFHRGSLGSPPEVPARGEMVVVIGPPAPESALEGEALDYEITALLDQGHRPKAVASLLAARSPRRQVYSRAVELLACSSH